MTSKQAHRSGSARRHRNSSRKGLQRRTLRLEGLETRVVMDYASAVLADNPVSFWRFETDSPLADSAPVNGGAQNLTPIGSPTFGQPGAVSGSQAVRFNPAVNDGTNDAFTALSVPITPSFTVELWGKSATPTWNEFGWLASERGPNGFIMHQDLGTTNWQGYVYDQFGGIAGPIGNASTAPITDWHHYALTFDVATSTARIFVDGVVVGTSITAPSRSAGNINIELGRDDTGARFGNGFLDEVAVYQTALSPADILRHFQAAGTAWTGAGLNNNWSNPANWAGGNVPDTVDETAVFTNTLGIGGGAVNVDGNFSLQAVEFVNTAGSFNLTGGTLNAGAITQTGAATNTIASTINPGTLSTTVSNYSGGDPGEGLDLQGTFLHALDFYAVGTLQVGDVVFVGTDNPLGTLSPPAGVAITAPNIAPGHTNPNYGSTTDDNNLEAISGTIRWNGAAPGISVSLPGLTVGQKYKLQLLFSDNVASRDFDVLVNGGVIVNNFSPGAVQGSVGGAPNRGAVITHSFVATSTTATISLPFGSGILGDPNPIISALTLEAGGGELTISAAAGTLHVNGGVNFGPSGKLSLTGAGAVNLGGVIAGGALAEKSGAGTATLSGNNSGLSGPITVSGGTLVAAHANALGTTGVGTTVAVGATLGLSGGVTIAEPITLGGTLRNLSGINTVTTPLVGPSSFTPINTLTDILGGDVGDVGVDLEGTFLYAVVVGGGAVGPLRDANFTDGSTGGGTLGATIGAPNQAGSWANPNYGTSVNDDLLENVTRNIRYGNPLTTVDLAGLVPGQAYKLQLMYNESCCTNRGFDISVEGSVIRPAFFPGVPATNVGRVVTYSFIATDSVLNIVQNGAISGDPNAILNAFTLEQLVLGTLPLTILSDAGTLNLNGNVDIGSTGNSVVGGAGEIIVNGNILGSGAATLEKTGGGTLRINGLTPVGVPVAVNGGTLAGTGIIRGAVTVNSPGALGAGSAAAVGGLTVNGNVVFNNLSTAAARISSVSNDKLVVNGTVTLNGIVIPDVNETAPFNAPTNQTFVLLQNDGVDPIVGTFAGAAEGALVDIGTNQFRVTYIFNAEVGSTVPPGNDIALIAVNRAPIANAGGPYSVTEAVNNNAVVLTLTHTSTDPDGDAITSVMWDVNGDGNYTDATGQNATLTWANLVALGIVEDGGPAPLGTVLLNKISVRVSDGDVGGTSNSPYVNLTVVNAPPTAVIAGPSIGVPAAPVNFNLTATDPSPADAAGAMSYVVDWDDGNVEPFSGLGNVPTPAAHTYADYGTYTITVIATDKDGGVQTVATTKVVTLVPVAKVGNDIVAAGTDGDDQIIFTAGNGSVSVKIKTAGVSSSYGPFPTSGLTKLIASGLAGNDNITVSNSRYPFPVIFSGGEGNDYLAGASLNDELNGEAGNDKLLGVAGNDTLDGGDDNDNLDGGAGNDLLEGGAGNDKALGGAGNDVLNGGDDNDSMDGGLGNDLLRGGAGNDTLVGNSGDDIVVGGEDNDRLVTGAGNDVLLGGEGKDSFDGGAGDDLLVTGTTDLDTETDDAILLAALDDWTNSRDVTALGTIAGDGETETLVGGVGADFFYINANDKAKDFKSTVGDEIFFL